MYEVNLEQLFNNEGLKLDVNRELDLSDIEISGMKPFRDPAKIVGTFENATGIVSITAKVLVDYVAICDRCACNVNKHLTIPMEHTFVTKLNDENNDEFIVVPNMRLDLDSLTTEDVLLNLPSKILCNEECKGICSSCGKNLNEGPCDCKKPVDPRLAGLLSLLEDE